MTRRIEKVAVLGAGTMGARIAAHLAAALAEWLTERGKANGQPVQVVINES